MEISAIVALIIQLMPVLVSAGTNGIALIEKIKAAAVQVGAWPPEAQAAYDSELEKFNTAEESKTDAEKGLPPLP